MGAMNADGLSAQAVAFRQARGNTGRHERPARLRARRRQYAGGTMRMRTVAIAILTVAVLPGFVAAGQSPAAKNLERVLPFTATPTPQGAAEIVRALSVMANNSNLASFDSARNAVVLQGPAPQVTLAECVFRQLQIPGTAECPVPDRDWTVRVYTLSHTPERQAVQELLNLLHGLADVQIIHPLEGRLVLAVSAGQAELVGFLVDALDRPVVDQPASGKQPARAYEYRLAQIDPIIARGGVAVRVFYPAHAGTLQELSDLVMLVRATGDVQRIYPNSAQRAVVMRGTAAQADLAAWLLDAVGEPRDAQNQSSAVYRYPDSFTGRDQVRVVPLAHTNTRQQADQLVNYVRARQQMPYLMVRLAPATATVRGTAAEVEIAERLIRESDAQAAR
jgi:hypothetical protein